MRKADGLIRKKIKLAPDSKVMCIGYFADRAKLTHSLKVSGISSKNITFCTSVPDIKSDEEMVKKLWDCKYHLVLGQIDPDTIKLFDEIKGDEILDDKPHMSKSDKNLVITENITWMNPNSAILYTIDNKTIKKAERVTI